MRWRPRLPAGCRAFERVMFKDLNAFIGALIEQHELAVIGEPVSPDL